ncbi:MAG: hypothetical protein ACOC3V_02670 [bacterium]
MIGKYNEFILEGLRYKMVGKTDEDILNKIKDYSEGKLINIAYDLLLHKFHGDIDEFIKYIKSSDFLTNKEKNNLFNNYVMYYSETDILTLLNREQLIKLIMSLF